MTKNTNLSRLNEVNFSNFNLRDAYITQNVEYLSNLRDESLFSNYGLRVLIRIPLTDDFDFEENYVDEYSNFVNIEWQDTVESVVPKFTQYRQNVSDDGMAADGIDGIYPLEVIIPTKLHLPRNSRIIFNEYDSKENKIAREWTVLGTVMKQLSDSKSYTRIANCVPSRKSSYENIDTSLSTIWFDWLSDCLYKTDALRANGTIWFSKKFLAVGEIYKAVRANDIYENIEAITQLYQHVSILMYYDNRSKHIISSLPCFEIGDEFEVYDESENMVYIDTEDDVKLPLKVIVTSINSDNTIKTFEYNCQEGYTTFGKTGIIEGHLKQNNKIIAKLNLISIDKYGDNYQEVIEDVSVAAPKYFIPYQMDAVFYAKRVSVSVLN